MRRALTTGMALLCGVVSGAALPAACEAQRRERDRITREEILSSSHRALDLYQVVRSLRPHFLAAPRGVRTLRGAPPAITVVYIDGTRAGELDQLRTIAAMSVEEVRYLDPARAENEFGITHSGGAILVRLVKALKPDTIPPP
jgi:hypothetical protein